MTAPPVGGDQPLPPQQLERLPYGLPADPEVLGQVALAGQPFAGRDDAGAQFAEQLGGDPPVERLPVGEGPAHVDMLVRGGAGHAAPSCG